MTDFLFRSIRDVLDYLTVSRTSIDGTDPEYTRAINFLTKLQAQHERQMEEHDRKLQKPNRSKRKKSSVSPYDPVSLNLFRPFSEGDAEC